MNRPTAKSLVKALATGEPDAFGALYDRLGRSMFRVANVMLRNTAEAEDALQDVFLQIARCPERLQRADHLDAYIFAMLHNNLKHRIRTRQREQQRLRELPERAAPSPVVPHDDLEAALMSLADEQREVISLKVDGGLTFAEIADVLGINANTAASRYRYGLERLRTTLERT